MRQSWTEEKIWQLVPKHRDMTSFIKNNGGAWNAAKSLGISELVRASFTPKKRGAYTFEEIVKIAAPCKKRSEFKKKNPSAYKAARILKVLDIVCTNMEDPITEAYEYEELYDLAQSCESRQQFRDEHSGAHTVACQRKILDKICEGLPESKNKKHTMEEVVAFFAKDGYMVIDKKYKNANTKIKTICPEGHRWTVRYGDFYTGYRCADCVLKGVSKMELELSDALKKFYPELTKKRFRVTVLDKPFIKAFDADIFDPKTKLGIEFDGTYYHSFKYMRDEPKKKKWSDDDIRNYHEIKDTALRSCHGISVLHIKEEDWKKDKQACINRCLEFLGAKNG